MQLGRRLLHILIVQQFPIRPARHPKARHPKLMRGATCAYGSLGAVIVLLLWLYITGLALLAGGEINSEIENAAAGRGHPEAKEAGEKAA